MPQRQLEFVAPDAVVETGLSEIRERLGIPEGFPAEVLEDARSIEPDLPDEDHTDIPFVTIDPPGSRDLDQALHIERTGSGYRVRYAIADVGAFVTPGRPLDDEARERGLTMYGPDLRSPLYPGILSEGMASLLPDELRPALVWTLDLDGAGEPIDVDLRRAMVRSREQYDYATVQSQLHDGTAPTSLRLLAEVGRVRRLVEQERGGVSLPIPDQQVAPYDGGWRLEYESPLPVEGWNAQISLLTGMVAADLMTGAGIGLLRTVPPARRQDIDRMRRVASALEIAWPGHVGYPELVRSLDSGIPAHAAMLAEATTLFSGASYQVLEQGTEPQRHAALATTYTHTTAPLRRLVDRYVGETCLAICAGREVPGWMIEALPTLPLTMARARSKSGSYEAECLNLVEAAVLSGREGQEFTGVIVEIDRDDPHGDVQIRHPAVHARIDGADLALGAEIAVRLVTASVEHRRVVFAPV